MRLKEYLKLVDKEPKDYYEKLALVESNGNPEAKAGTSSALGLYQFTKPTWNGLVKDLGLDYTLDDRMDPEKSKVVLDEFTKRNKAILHNRLGREPSNTELYMAHFMGAGGASKFLKGMYQDPNSKVENLVGQRSLTANPGVFTKNGQTISAAEVYNRFANKFGDKRIDIVNLKSQQDETPSFNFNVFKKTEIDNTRVKKPNVIQPNKKIYDFREEYENIKKSSRNISPLVVEKINEFSMQEKQLYDDGRTVEPVIQLNRSKIRQEDLTHLYNHIDTYSEGGEKGCGGLGQPPCREVNLKLKDNASAFINKPVISDLKSKNSSNENFNSILTQVNITPKEYLLNYIDSDNYRKRVESSGYIDPQKTIKDRRERVENVNIINDDSDSGSYYDNDGNVYLNKDQAKKLGVDPKSMLAHELSHAEFDNKDGFYVRFAQGKMDINPNDQLEINNRTKRFKILTDWTSKMNEDLSSKGFSEEEISDMMDEESVRRVEEGIDPPLGNDVLHDSRGDEVRADLNALRFDLYRSGIYDTTKDTFTIDHLNKLQDNFVKDRLLKNYSEEDLIWLMNNIASNREKSVNKNTRLT